LDTDFENILKIMQEFDDYNTLWLMNCIIIDDEEMASDYCAIHFKEYYITIEMNFQMLYRR
jgi:hypothetical protein